MCGRGACERGGYITMQDEKTRHQLVVLGAVAATLIALYVLAPVLTPFMVSLLLAYLGDPWVDRLQTHGLTRTQAVALVFFLILMIAIPVPIVLTILLQHEVAVVIKKIPHYLDWIQGVALPRLQTWMGLDPSVFDIDRIKQLLTKHWQQVGGMAAAVGSILSQSGFALLNAAANFVLIPVVAFYLLRDWDVMIDRLREMLPRSMEPSVVGLATECDAVIGNFMRGQLAVMLALSVIYTLGLYAVGLDLALLIGLGAGLVSFVPYLGFAVGVVTAGIAALFQFQDVLHLMLVVGVFGFGQLMESLVLTPVLLGDRIGLHPVLVIFAVMVGGFMFGFFGVLLAVPVAAVGMVLLRHAHDRYRRSQWYGSAL